jgi:hypothetical protein
MNTGMTAELTSEGMLIKGRVLPMEMGLPFMLRLDNVRQVIMLPTSPHQIKHVPFNKQHVTGLELSKAIDDYIDAYDEAGRKPDMSNLRVGDLVRGETVNSYMMLLQFDATLTLTIEDDAVLLELWCPDAGVRKIQYCSSRYIHLSHGSRHPDDID